MSRLHDELVDESVKGACKICTFLYGLDPDERREWETELALPVKVIAHAAVVVALKRRGVSIEEASVRRHRRNHVVR